MEYNDAMTITHLSLITIPNILINLRNSNQKSITLPRQRQMKSTVIANQTTSSVENNKVSEGYYKTDVNGT